MTYAREPMRAVKARLGKFQDDVKCECLACRVAEVDEAPVLVPDGLGPDEFGVEVEYGRWLHGPELRKHLEVQRRLRALIERFPAPVASAAQEERPHA